MSIHLFKAENIQNSLYRYYFANNYAYIIGGVAHVCFIPIFYFLNITVMVYYNIFSILIFIISFILNRKGLHALSTVPASIEVMLHATLATYITGWETGFFYYTLAIIPLVFSSPTTSNIQKITLSILIATFYLSLKHYANTHAPLIMLSTEVINQLYFMNSFFIIAGISALVYYFSLASEITENKIDQKRNEADQANQAKSLFLANMSHELRTPLNAIIGYSEMLKDEAIESGNRQHIKDLTKISSAGNHLLNLINSILDLTKIEAGKTEIEYQRVNINTLSNDIITTIKPLIDKGGNILIVDCADDVGEYCVDQTKVKQILFNLLSNACKFTGNGTITYSVSIVNIDNNDWLWFTITDTGIGIANEKLEQLFMPFVQADISTTRLYGGTGLGLTISKHFATLMGGVIEVDSTPGKGTTFTVKLPVDDNYCAS